MPIHLTRLLPVQQPYFVAETTMPGMKGFDFFGASWSFNVLAEYLFGKVFNQVYRVVDTNHQQNI